jgi:hypothetical protein
MIRHWGVSCSGIQFAVSLSISGQTARSYFDIYPPVFILETCPGRELSPRTLHSRFPDIHQHGEFLTHFWR